MTDKNYTHIAVVLDRSGSMATIAEDTKGGFNTFIEEQRKVDGKCTVTLAQFDDRYELVYQDRPIEEVEPLVLIPRGSTALLDGIGRTIYSTGRTLAALPEDERPGVVLFVVLTDGWENASQEYTREAIKNLIETQTTQFNWQFIFMGSNQDAVTAGASMGFSTRSSLTYTGSNVGVAFASTASNVSNYRNAVADIDEDDDDAPVAMAAAGAFLAYTDTQREDAATE